MAFSFSFQWIHCSGTPVHSRGRSALPKSQTARAETRAHPKPEVRNPPGGAEGKERAGGGAWRQRRHKRTVRKDSVETVGAGRKVAVKSVFPLLAVCLRVGEDRKTKRERLESIVKFVLLLACVC
ncbi:unnamed protein product [Tuber aestivum]|uniref:Uncharacterized protein n=1 Tax=Tuber aestivum TaxID=59557 RepID=A0A292PXY7_9PEZI|nr:unnamed protein product [Tuber aestivum]